MVVRKASYILFVGQWYRKNALNASLKMVYIVPNFIPVVLVARMILLLIAPFNEVIREHQFLIHLTIFSPARCRSMWR